MKFNLENSQRIRNLSIFLCLGAIMISVVYVDIKVFLFLGRTADTFLVSIYTFLPPLSWPNPPKIHTISPMTPLKDVIYGSILGMLFLFFGYFRIKMRWLFHFIIAFLGFCGILFFYSKNSIFLVNDIIVALFFILVAITGFNIYTDGRTGTDGAIHEQK